MMDKSAIESEEFERKFLIPYLPAEITDGILKGKYDFEKIIQGYLPDKKRIRKTESSDGKISYFITEKGIIPNTHGLSSFEKTKNISSEEFEKYSAQAQGELIFKTRYFIPFEDHILELNMFHERLEGQMLGEIEFENLDQALEFEKPEWIGREVTTEINNRQLAMGMDIPQE